MASAQVNLIVNYIPQSFDDQALYNLFSKVGQVESCKIMKDNITGYSYGYGFVNYALPDSAERAIEKLNGYQIANKRIKVSYARPSGDNIKDTNLYITNLPRHYSKDDLEQVFSKFGNIVQSNVLKDKVTGLSRGVAFVRFEQKAEAQKAITELDGVELDTGTGRISVRVAEEHGKSKAAYIAGLQASMNHQLRQSFNAPWPLHNIRRNPFPAQLQNIRGNYFGY